MLAGLAEQLADAVTQHATPVGSGTVARTQRIPIEKRVEDCLAKLAESSDPRTELWFRPPLQRYRQRQKAQGK